MLESMSKMFLDAYERPARLLPALLVLLPVPVLVVCFFGSVKIVATSAISVIAYCGAGYALARIARNAGKGIQDRLFVKWGGAPTTQLLRHSNKHFDAHTKERFHAVLSAGLGKVLPNPTSELAEPAAADELYRAAAIWLIGQTRDTKRFPLVFKENVSFGFHRNALGVRWFGVTVTLACLFIAMVNAKVLGRSSPYFSLERLAQLSPVAALFFGVSCLMLLAWLFWLGEVATKRAGFAYAERLLQSCDDLKEPPVRTRKPKVGLTRPERPEA